jgi:putative PIN family toxin of toxin-antitoxin system
VRIVLDTSVMNAALRSPKGAAAEILRHVLAGRIALLMDYKLTCEYEAVALRPQHLHAAGRSRTEAVTLLETLYDLAEAVLVSYRYRPLSPDSDDDMLLELAINGQADAVVSFNAKHFSEPLRAFGIEVYRPAEFLKRLSRRK